MFVFDAHLVLHFLFFFFNDTATTEIYTLSLHDALPIFVVDRTTLPFNSAFRIPHSAFTRAAELPRAGRSRDRKSTRLNSSHLVISYAVFCLKKKKITHITLTYKNKRCNHIMK